MPAFSLPHNPPLIHMAASPRVGRSPTTPTPCTENKFPRGFLVSIRGFGGVLKPRYIVGAEPLDQ